METGSNAVGQKHGHTLQMQKNIHLQHTGHAHGRHGTVRFWDWQQGTFNGVVAASRSSYRNQLDDHHSWHKVHFASFEVMDETTQHAAMILGTKLCLRHFASKAMGKHFSKLDGCMLFEPAVKFSVAYAVMANVRKTQ